MLSGSAYSFRMKSRLAISLSWIGGFTNVVALLALGHVVSHVTGTSTELLRDLGMYRFRHAVFPTYLLLTFLFGAACSAFLTEWARRRGWRSKFILPIGLEAALLAIFMYLMRGDIDHHFALRMAAFGIASFAMGLQNATITKISGAIVRTTHLTGIFTDLGLEGMQFLFWWTDELARRRLQRAGRMLKISTRHPTALRLLLLLSIAGSFGFGAIVGTITYSKYSALALTVPITFLLFILTRDWRSPIADIRELDVLNDEELKLQGIVAKLLPPEVVLYRAVYGRKNSKAHRAPDFHFWLERAPARCRVVLLAISPLMRFDANAVLDLGDAVVNLHARRKELILAGITTTQYKALDSLGATRSMDPNNLCPDVEFAIARAMVVLEEMRAQNGAAG